MRINTRLLLALLVFCSVFLANSHLLRAQTFSGMLVGGFNLAQIDGDRLSGFNKLGVNAGARVSARLTDRWHLSTEFLYSQQGANRTNTDDISSIYDKIQLNFVEVPFMINFSDWKILASAGISYNRLINYEVIDNLGTDITDLEAYREDLAGLVFGATYFLSEKWALNIRWSKHLTSMKEKDSMGVDPQNFVGRNLGIRVYFIL